MMNVGNKISKRLLYMQYNLLIEIGPSNFLDGFLVYVSVHFIQVRAYMLPVTENHKLTFRFLNILKLQAKGRPHI